MQSGQVAAAVEDQAYSDLLVKQGMHELVSLAKENIPYITNALVVNNTYSQAQPKIVEAMVRGTDDGLKYVLDPSHKQQVIAEIAKWERADANSPEMATVYDNLLTSLTKDPTPAVAGAETILKALQSMDPNRYAKLTAAEAIDPSYMQRILAASSSAAPKSA
jgi:ABC-type nitrate/sulfonate/bicarbonate transport system substrate-binding protein